MLPLLLLAPIGTYPSNFALSFDAARRDVVRVPHEATMDGPLIDSWTIEAWVRPTEWQQPVSAGADGRVLNVVGFHGRHPSLGMTVDGHAVARLWVDGGEWFTYEGSTRLTDGEWHHVAATWSGSAEAAADRKLSLYVDGELEPAVGPDDDGRGQPKRPEYNDGGVAPHRPAARCTGAMCEEGMQIGGFYCCGGGGYTGSFLNGTIDEVRVWTTPVPQADIRARMRSPLDPSLANLLFYFALDEAGMEQGANVIESRALPWFGMLGNSQGAGRPKWTVFAAPLSCTPGSRAYACSSATGGPLRVGGPSWAVSGGGYSFGALVVAALLAATATGALAVLLTHAAVRGHPAPLPSVTDIAQSGQRWVAENVGAVGGASGRAAPPAPSDGAPPGVDGWKWAGPPPRHAPTSSSGGYGTAR